MELSSKVIDQKNSWVMQLFISEGGKSVWNLLIFTELMIFSLPFCNRVKINHFYRFISNCNNLLFSIFLWFIFFQKVTGRQEFKELNILRTEKINYKCTETMKNNGELDLRNHSESRAKVFTAAMMGSKWYNLMVSDSKFWGIRKRGRIMKRQRGKS